MGLFKRIKNITLAEVNGLLDKVEDPIHMLNQYVREMEEEIATGEQALAAQIFFEKRQLVSITNAEEWIAKRTRQAQLAVDQGEEQIAKLALKEKLIYEKNLTLYKDQYESIKNQTTILYEKLNVLKQKYEELIHKRMLLVSRANTAQSIKQMNQRVVSMNSDQLSTGFSRMEERVLLMEAEVEASNQMSMTGRSISQVDTMLQAEVEKELERLKEKRKDTA